MKHIDFNFELDEKFLCAVDTSYSYSIYRGKESLTEEELVKVLRGEDIVRIGCSDDHPEFTKFRDNIEEMGFIKTMRNCWNGDEVISPFTLNGVIFRKGDRFPSAGAMSYHLEFRKKYGKRGI